MSPRRPNIRAGMVAEIIGHAVVASLSLVVVLGMAASGADVVQLAVVAGAVVVLHSSIAVARRRPMSAFLVAAAAMLALVFVPMPGWSTGILLPSALCFLVVGWHLTSVGTGRLPWAVLATFVTGVVMAELLAASRLAADVPVGLQLLECALLLAIAVGTWATAWIARRRRERVEAQQRARITAARTAERAAIRRDLHDVISHSLTLVVAQAEAARVGTTDASTRQAFRRLADTGRDALDGLRAMLRVLDATPASVGDLVPSLEALPALIEDAATPLHAVTLAERGERRALRPDAETALVRIVQEGVTNALRHVVPPVAIVVRLAWGDGAVDVEVSDDGGGGIRLPGQAGSGLRGIRDRVESAGGTFSLEVSDGWTLRARLPTRAAS